MHEPDINWDRIREHGKGKGSYTRPWREPVIFSTLRFEKLPVGVVFRIYRLATDLTV